MQQHKRQEGAAGPANAPGQDAQRTPLPPARLGRALKEGVQAAWDRLGLVIGFSLTWAVLATVSLGAATSLRVFPVAGRVASGFLLTTFVLAPIFASACRCALLALTNEEVGYLDLWAGARTLILPAARLAALNLLVLAVFVVNIWFYWRIGGIGQVAAMLATYIILFWLMMAVYHFPLLAAQEMGCFDEPGKPAKRTTRAIIRRAFYLTLGDPVFTAGLIATLGGITILTFLAMFPVPLIWMGATAFLSCAAVRLLLIKYGVLPPPPPEDIPPDNRAFRFSGTEAKSRQNGQNAAE